MLSTRVMYEFGKDIAKLIRMVMDSNVGINQKIRRNTLSTSEIYRELAVYATNDGDLVFDIILNDYIQFIETGRRKGAKFPPVKPIIDWCVAKGLPTDNSTIFLIRRAIARDGIKPRPVLQYVFEELDKTWNDGTWSDRLFDLIMEKIDNFFNS